MISSNERFGEVLVAFDNEEVFRVLCIFRQQSDRKRATICNIQLSCFGFQSTCHVSWYIYELFRKLSERCIWIHFTMHRRLTNLWLEVSKVCRSQGLLHMYRIPRLVLVLYHHRPSQLLP
jgi:hypothetical protein